MCGSAHSRDAWLFVEHPSGDGYDHEEDHEGDRRDREVVVRTTPPFRKSRSSPSVHSDVFAMSYPRFQTRTHSERFQLRAPVIVTDVELVVGTADRNAFVLATG
jgi:hypothetical protein